MSRLWCARAVVLLVGAAASCTNRKTSANADTARDSSAQVTSSAAIGTASVTGARIAVAHAGLPGEWQMPAGDYASSR